jgi:hypothetical protein
VSGRARALAPVVGAYAVASGLLVAVGVVLGIVVLDSARARAVMLAAAIAWGVQAVAFAALMAWRDRVDLFMVGWVGGIGLRFAVVAVVAFWARRSPVVFAESLLVGLVAFMFLMLLLEPVFMRRGAQT